MSKGLLDIMFDTLWDAVDGDAIVGRRCANAVTMEEFIQHKSEIFGEEYRDKHAPSGKDASNG